MVEAFRLLSEVFEEIDLESSGVRQKNSSSADEDSPNFPLLILELLEQTFPDNPILSMKEYILKEIVQKC